MKSAIPMQELMSCETNRTTLWDSREDTAVERPVRSMLAQFREQITTRDAEIVSLKEILKGLMERYDLSQDVASDQLRKIIGG